MRMVLAIIKPFKLDEVAENLLDKGCLGLTVQEVKGFARQRGHTELYRGQEYGCELVSKIQLTILVDDSSVDAIKDVIMNSCRTGKIGDGIIWDIPIDNYTRIRTGEECP